MRSSRVYGHDGTVKNVSDRESSDVELLTTIIAGGNARARQTATQLLQQFGNLRVLLHASDAELSRFEGLGRARLQRLRALPILARRYFEESLPCGEAIRSPSDTESFLKARMQHLGHELFCCLYLDNRHRVLRFDELFRGTIDGTSVYPREVVKEALSVNAHTIKLVVASCRICRASVFGSNPKSASFVCAFRTKASGSSTSTESRKYSLTFVLPVIAFNRRSKSYA